MILGLVSITLSGLNSKFQLTVGTNSIKKLTNYDTKESYVFGVCIHDGLSKWEDIFKERSGNASLNSYVRNKPRT